MHWQEIAFLIGQMLFNVALLPSIFSKDKPALKTSLLTSSVILVYIFLYASLSLWITAVAVGTTGALWSILAYQKFIIDRRKR